MKPRAIADGVTLLGTVDWDRRLFDALIPTPDGTSYNAYLIRGRDRTALVDTSDTERGHDLRDQLADVPKIDFVVSSHSEQDHAGQLPWVLERYPEARVLASTRGSTMVVDHLRIPADRVQAVKDGETLDLGGKTLEFIYTPWVHWPETMSTYLREDRILFSCDFFGAHLATADLYATDEARVLDAARRYYAEIMLPTRNIIRTNLEKLKRLEIATIAPSHGPVHNRPARIVDAYRAWSDETPRNRALLAYVSMHGSTRELVHRLADELIARGVGLDLFELTTADLGRVAEALIDAATLALGTPVVNAAPHPAASYAAGLVNVLRPKLRLVTAVGSCGWGPKPIETKSLAALMPNVRAEGLPGVICRGKPQAADLEAVGKLAETIAEKHRALGLK